MMPHLAARQLLFPWSQADRRRRPPRRPRCACGRWMRLGTGGPPCPACEAAADGPDVCRWRRVLAELWAEVGDMYARPWRVRRGYGEPPPTGPVSRCAVAYHLGHIEYVEATLAQLRRPGAGRESFPKRQPLPGDGPVGDEPR